MYKAHILTVCREMFLKDNQEDKHPGDNVSLALWHLVKEHDGVQGIARKLRTDLKVSLPKGVLCYYRMESRAQWKMSSRGLRCKYD